MMKGLLTMLGVTALYLLFWPVPVEPVAWQAPANPGYHGDFAVNNKLAPLELFELDDLHGPEDIALDTHGRIYASTAEGYIIRLSAQGDHLERWAATGGRPLGIEFDAEGHLIVADAYRGLLSIDPAGVVTVLTDSVLGETIGYADDVAIAEDGMIYFSDASTRFGARQNGGTYEASLLDIVEHGAHGRLLSFDPTTRATQVLATGINFANGVAVSPDQQSVLVNETGSYRVLRLWVKGAGLTGDRKGSLEPVIENLPGFPDNLSVGLEGKFWLGLISPRSAILDALSDQPWVRKVLQRLPAFARPKAQRYGHVLAFDGEGKVLENLQAPETAYSHMTGVIETPEYLYISSLEADTLARLKKEKR